MPEAPIVAFIGFGEAARALAAGLNAAGCADLRAADPAFDDPARGEAARAAADQSGVRALALAEALRGAEVVVSAVTADQCVAAAEVAARHLGPGQVFFDINSASPQTKEQAARAVEAAGAAYVDGAAMDRVGKQGHRVPLLAAGPAAGALAVRLNALGMRIDAVGPEVGQASTLKMLRSVLVKGLGSLVGEALLAAHRAGLTARVVADLDAYLPGVDWGRFAAYHQGRIWEHARRRSAEMGEAAATLEALGLPASMTRGAAAREAWVADLGLKDKFPGPPPEDLDAILAAFDRAARAGAAPAKPLRRRTSRE